MTKPQFIKKIRSIKKGLIKEIEKEAVRLFDKGMSRKEYRNFVEGR